MEKYSKAFSAVERKTPCLFSKFTFLSNALWKTQPLGRSWLAFDKRKYISKIENIKIYLARYSKWVVFSFRSYIEMC